MKRCWWSRWSCLCRGAVGSLYALPKHQLTLIVLCIRKNTLHLLETTSLRSLGTQIFFFPFKKTYIDFGTCECMKWASRSKTALLKAQRSRKANLHGDPLTSLQQSVCGLTQREMFFRKATIKFILSTCFEWHLRRPTDSCKSDVYLTWPDRNDMYTTSSFVFSPCLFVVKLNTKSFYLKWHFT